MLTRAIVPTAKHETQVSYNAIKQSFVYNGIKREITRTYYDRTKFSNIQAGFTQENLRPRVASVTYQDIEGANYDRATHYSYDVHGNVKNLIQEISANGVSLKKRMDYDYDLVSGKVNFMYYQKKQSDQFIHRYEYDGDNRIVKVFTSRDAITWDRDAKYDYYAHGPLAKTTIGEHEVESNTYAYTIQGWIKGVNGNSFSYALGYFNDGVHQDYQGIGGGSNYTLSTAVASGKSLYNGNIATMASKTPQFASQGGADWVQQFEYDQLNRIKQSSSLGWVDANNQPVPDAFKTSYTYDAGGNIDTLIRYDKDGNQFDEMIYNYENTSEGYKTNTNKLRWVDDTEPVADHTNDVDDQDVGNYTYDDIGNLIADKSEEIENIEWTVYGKVKKVIRKVGSIKPDLEFAYDASGNRIAKIVREDNGDVKTTYYLKDVLGNIISIYEKNNSASFVLTEQYVYGENRLLTLKPLNNDFGVHVLGQKEYEIADHLNNARIVLSDKSVLGGEGEIIAAIDYLPFGMVARSYNSSTYRFGFNGEEKDFENFNDAYDFGSRIYDSRLGRFTATDPLHKKYPGINPYHFSANCPIAMIDVGGLDGIRNGSNATITATIILIYDPVAIPIATAITAAANAQTNINTVWSAQTYNGMNVTSNVTVTAMTQVAYNAAAAAGTLNPTDGQTNVMQLTSDGTRSQVNFDQRTGSYDVSDLTGASNTAAHEFGHMLGLDDRYQYIQGYSTTTGAENQWLEVVLPTTQVPNDPTYQPLNNLYSTQTSVVTQTQLSFVFNSSNGATEGLTHFSFFSTSRSVLPRGGQGLQGGGIVAGLNAEGGFISSNPAISVQGWIPSSTIQNLNNTNFQTLLSGQGEQLGNSVGNILIEHQNGQHVARFSSGANTVQNLQNPYTQ